MQRRQKAVFFGSITIPLLVGLSLVAYRFFPNFSRDLLWMGWGLLLLALPWWWQLKSTPIQSELFSASKAFWWARVFLIQIGFILFFLNSIECFSTAEVNAGVLPVDQQAVWLAHLVKSAFSGVPLFPWIFLLSALVIFVKYRQQYPTETQPMTQFSDRFFRPFLKNTLDLYPKFSIRFLLISSIAACFMQLLTLNFSTLSPFSQVILAAMTSGALLILLFSKHIQKRLTWADQHQVPLWMILALAFLIILGISCLIVFIFSYFHVYQLSSILSVQTNWYRPAVNSTLWIDSFWIVVMPTYVSLMWAISSGKTLNQLLFANVLLPMVLALVIGILPWTWLVALLQQPFVTWSICAGALALLLWGSALPGIYRALMVGCFPPAPERRKRRPKSVQLIQLSILLAGLLSAWGYSGWLNFWYTLALGILFVFVAAAVFLLRMAKA